MMRRKKSCPSPLTSRVLAFVTLAIGLSLVLSSLLVLQSIRDHFAEQDVDELRTIVQSIEHTLSTALENGASIEESLARAVAGHHGVYFQVEDDDGTLLFRTPGIDFFDGAAALSPVRVIDEDHVSVWASGGKNFRGVVTTLTARSEIYRITAAIDLDFHLFFLHSFRNSLWLIMLGTGAITLLAAWFGIHQGLLPLRSLSEGMRKIQANHLDERLDADTLPTELRELAVSFNQMIGRLEEGFERLSHFSADIAHELRTPLTNLITQSQVGLSKPRSADEYRELLYSSLEEQERMSKMVGDMLWLAKSDNDLIKPVFVPLDLTQEFKELFEFFDALTTEHQVQLVLEGNAPVVRGDRALLRRAFSNLLSNAIRYTPHGEIIRIHLSVDEGAHATVSIANPGEDVPAEHLPKLFDRFYRVDPSRQRQSEGTGLGLAITKAIVESHDGVISAQSGNGTTCFVVSLPSR